MNGKIKNAILLIILCFMTLPSTGQGKKFPAVDRLFADWDTAKSPGCAVGIFKGGKLIHAKGYGMANLEHNIPISPSSVFRIGSTSKQFTAACIVLLVEKGKLSLDKTLKAIYPDFPDYAQKITIRHLLNHTSGIRDYLLLAYLKGLDDHDYYRDKDVMEWLVSQNDLNFKPGSEFLYSNSGYWLLGQIVQETTGMNMADFAKKEIFDPLGMSNTHFHNDHTLIVKNRASGYLPDGEKGFKISMTTLDMIGDGGIFTTINDIKIWDDAFYKSRVFSRKFWEMMTEKGVLNDGEVIKYASGLLIDEYKGLKTISHGGAFVGFTAELIRFPEEQFTVAVFANRGDANPTKMGYQVADILLKDKLKGDVNTNSEKETTEVPEASGSGPEFELAQMVGKYEVAPGITLNLTLKNGSLNVVESWNDVTYNIYRTEGNTFKIVGDDEYTFVFLELKDGFTQQLDIYQNGNKTVTKRQEEIDMSKVNLEDYAGSYYSEELDVTYHFEVDDNVLKARAGSNSPLACHSAGADAFSVAFGLMRFQRAQGLVSGFELDSGRVKGLRFEKR